MDNQLVKSIQTRLTSLESRLGGKDLGLAEWTKQIKLELVQLCREMEWHHHCSETGNAEGGREWLFDFTAIEFNEENYEMRTIYLIVESEWSKNLEDIKYDFQKLICARSKLRLMIFQGNSTDSIQSTINELMRLVHAFEFSNKSDEYMFACWNNQKGSFEFETRRVDALKLAKSQLQSKGSE